MCRELRRPTLPFRVIARLDSWEVEQVYCAKGRDDMSLKSKRRQRGHRVAGIAEMKKVCQQWTTDSRGRSILAGSLYNRFVLRPISIYVTWLCVRLGMRAHMATLLMTVAGLTGVVLCLPHAMHLTILGGIFFFLFDLMDAVDGEIARWTATSTTRGLYLDQISHVFVDYPSRCVAALHLYLWTSDTLYMFLGIAAVGSSVTARAVREIYLRINAEALRDADPDQSQALTPTADTLFAKMAGLLKRMQLTTFPIVKPRIVHIATVTGILLSYGDSTGLLVILSWLYGIYCTTWLVFEIPYYFYMRLINVPHVKRVEEYKWPI